MNTPAGDPVQPLRPRIQRALDRFIADQRELLAEIGPELGLLADAAADLLSGGKRLRPAFCYWGWRGAGRDDAESIVTAAAALELFHAAALVHDDLIDGSDTRRGMPSAHRRFASGHTAEGWAGESSQFGAAAAILLGDLLLGWSDELINGSGLDDAALRRARPVYERMRTEVGAGQYLDVLAQAVGTARPDERIDRARRVIRYKAARYSVEWPLLLGGCAAGAGADLQAAYSAYGLALGVAFQLRDDVLGVFGDPDRTGKPAGDLREGKQTLLIAFALERADPATAATVDRLLGDPNLDPAGVERLQSIIVDTGALARVEAEVADQVDRARSALARVAVTAEADRALQALISAAAIRTT
ncbi:MAG TPA: polyprenyl synthetase family protein [Jiangellaceae bacterium]|nr:polyprenyl synthetase family protein [Jiangellaceae bacterium]